MQLIWNWACLPRDGSDLWGLKKQPAIASKLNKRRDRIDIFKQKSPLYKGFRLDHVIPNTNRINALLPLPPSNSSIDTLPWPISRNILSPRGALRRLTTSRLGVFYRLIMSMKRRRDRKTFLFFLTSWQKWCWMVNHLKSIFQWCRWKISWRKFIKLSGGSLLLTYLAFRAVESLPCWTQCLVADSQCHPDAAHVVPTFS